MWAGKTEHMTMNALNAVLLVKCGRNMNHSINQRIPKSKKVIYLNRLTLLLCQMPEEVRRKIPRKRYSWKDERRQQVTKKSSLIFFLLLLGLASLFGVAEYSRWRTSVTTCTRYSRAKTRSNFYRECLYWGARDFWCSGSKERWQWKW